MASNWDYKELYKKYQMDDEIRIGTGIVKVHDICNPLPEFMKSADVIFVDPPCNKGNLSSFYTKLGTEKKDRPFDSYTNFEERLFECIDEIRPRLLFIEVFMTNEESYSEQVHRRYPNVILVNSMYYNNPKNKCKILIGGYDNISAYGSLSGLDEEDVIHWICKNVDYDVIGDPCMGKGLVGFYSDMYGKKFVGTELNGKRLAVLLERITTKKRGNIN